MQKIYVLDVNGPNGSVVHPVVIQGEKDMLLIDTGYVGQLNEIEKAFIAKSLDMSQVTHVLITHHDHDHVGGLKALKALIPELIVITSDEQKPYIEGNQRSLRIQQAEKIYNHLSESEKPAAEAFRRVLLSVEPVPVDKTVSKDTAMELAGGIEILMTPGHMPGHLSVYLKSLKVFISGDAMVAENGQLMVANPQYTLDMDAALESIKRISKLDIDTVICYHGGLVQQGGKALKAIVEAL